jgi:hypothetical protein
VECHPNCGCPVACHPNCGCPVACFLTVVAL